MSDYAVILTHNRHELLRSAVAGIAPQVDRVAVVDNASYPPVTFESIGGHQVHSIITSDEQPPNLAFLMNEGFDWAEQQAKELGETEWFVALLCDDVLVPAGWFAAVKTALQQTGTVMGSTHQSFPVTQPIVKTQPDADIVGRLQGSAFVVRGEVGLRADEEMHWWWQDTDLDWQARLRGGSVIAPGPTAVNLRPNDFTNARPELARRAGVDGEVFARKWGTRPW